MILPIIYPSAVFYWRDKKGLNKIIKGLSDPNKCRTLPEHYKLPAREVISSYLQYEMNMKTPLSLTILGKKSPILCRWWDELPEQAFLANFL